MAEKIWKYEMKKKVVLITGGAGLVGSAIKSISKDYKNYDFVYTQRKLHDLTKEQDVARLYLEARPDYVIHAAARVGGIGRNLNSPAQQFYDNILMNSYMIHYAHLYNIEKLIAFSSVCVFPAGVPTIKESILHDSPPFPAHRSYAYAKRMVDIQIESYKSQYNRNYCSAIPANIYGENDNFNLEDGHVVPSLIYKCFLSKQSNSPFKIWGDGTPKREFVYSKDIARACLDLFSKEILPQRLIISSHEELEIRQLVEKICNIFDYHNVEWSPDKPNGQLRRPSDRTLFDQTFENFNFTDMDVALKNTVEWFMKNYPKVRV
jgi:GDP-L-fucose synthase